MSSTRPPSSTPPVQPSHSRFARRIATAVGLATVPLAFVAGALTAGQGVDTSAPPETSPTTTSEPRDVGTPTPRSTTAQPSPTETRTATPRSTYTPPAVQQGTVEQAVDKFAPRSGQDVVKMELEKLYGPEYEVTRNAQGRGWNIGPVGGPGDASESLAVWNGKLIFGSPSGVQHVEENLSPQLDDKGESLREAVRGAFADFDQKLANANG